MIDYFFSSYDLSRDLMTSLISLLGLASALCFDLDASFFSLTSFAVDGRILPATGLTGFPAGFLASSLNPTLDSFLVSLGDPYGGDHLGSISANCSLMSAIGSFFCEGDNSSTWLRSRGNSASSKATLTFLDVLF